MKFELKKQLRDKASYSYGLSNVLRYEIDILRKDTRECNPLKLKETIHNTSTTLQKLLLIIGELEYILKLDKIEGP